MNFNKRFKTKLNNGCDDRSSVRGHLDDQEQVVQPTKFCL